MSPPPAYEVPKVAEFEVEFSPELIQWLRAQSKDVRTVAGTLIKKLEHAGYRLGKNDAKKLTDLIVTGIDRKPHPLRELIFSHGSNAYRIGFIAIKKKYWLLSGGAKDGVPKRQFYETLRSEAEKRWRREQAQMKAQELQ